MTDPIETIIEVLSPVLGDHMSRSIVTGSLQKMGKTRASATANDLERLIHDLAPGLNVFVGRQVSKTIIQDLCHKLGYAPRS